MTNIEAVACRKTLQVRRQIFRLWNPGAIEQNGDHRDVALQRGRDLDTDEIVLVIETPLALSIAGIEPMAADDRQSYRTCRPPRAGP